MSCRPSQPGEEYDSVAKQVYSNNGTELYQIQIDGSVDQHQRPVLRAHVQLTVFSPGRAAAPDRRQYAVRRL